MIDDPLIQKSVELVEALLVINGAKHVYIVTNNDLSPPLSMGGKVARVSVELIDEEPGEHPLITMAGVRSYN